MERAKTFFGNRDHDGYVGKEEHLVSASEKLPFIKAICKQLIELRPHIRNIDFMMNK